MAETQKRTSSSFVNSKDKNSLLDLDIGTDFLSSWKSMSVGDGDGMDFDLPPTSKGNKNSFCFEKMDMDFNLDGDFGKLPSFNMDMSDLDISPQLKKDGKAAEKSKGSSNENDKGKTDPFSFAFDFELDDFSIEATLTKEGSKAQKEKDKVAASPTGSKLQEQESSSFVSIAESANILEDEAQTTPLPGSSITSVMDFHDSRSADLECTGKKGLPESTEADYVPPKIFTATDEVASNKAEISHDAAICSTQLAYITQSKKSVPSEKADPEAHTRTDAVNLLPSSSFSHNHPTGCNSGEARNDMDCLDTNATVSTGEQDVAVTLIVGSMSNNKLTVLENSEDDSNAISEKNYGEKSQGEIEDHVRNNKNSTKLDQVSPPVEKVYTTVSEPVVLSDTLTGREVPETFSDVRKLPSVSGHPADILLPKEDAENQRKPLLSRKEFIQSGTLECHLQMGSLTQEKQEPSKKKEFTQTCRTEGRSDLDTIQSHRRLASLSLSRSQAPYKGEHPKIHGQQIIKGLNVQLEVLGADGLQNESVFYDCPAAQNLNTVKEKSSQRQSDTSIKDTDTLRKVCNIDGVKEGKKLSNFPTEKTINVIQGKSSQMQRDINTKEPVAFSSNTEIHQKIALKSKLASTVISLPLTRNIPEGPKLSAVEGSRQTRDLCGQKLSSINLHSKKPSCQKDVKLVTNICQNRLLSGNKPLEINYSAGSQMKTPLSLSLKRKIVEECNVDKIVLYPSKRASQSPIRSRQIVEMIEKVSDKKEASHSAKGNDSTKSNIGDCQVTTVEVPNKLNLEELETSFSVDQNGNIRQAEAYAKGLDDISNMLRKKQEEAKELLVRAIVNSNKLLMLNHPLLKEKICATQNLFARLTLNEGHAEIISCRNVI